MYTHLYLHTHIIHTYIYIHTCAHIYLHTHMYTHLYLHTCTHLYLHTHMYTYLLFTHMYTHLYVHRHIICTHLCLHTQVMHTLIFTQMYKHLRVCSVLTAVPTRRRPPSYGLCDVRRTKRCISCLQEPASLPHNTPFLHDTRLPIPAALGHASQVKEMCRHI